jgi:hypothetical protein
VPAWSRFALACMVAMGSMAAHEASAQEASRVRVVISGADPLREDLQALIEMAPTPKLRKQWTTLDETLLSFLEGVDSTKPIALDIVFEPEGLAYSGIVPIIKFDGKGSNFLANMKAMFKVGAPDAGGVISLTNPQGGGKKKAAAAGPPAKPLFLRHVHKHAFLSLKKADVAGNVPDPAQALAALIGNQDAVVRIENDAKTLPARQKTFLEFRKQIEAAIKFKRGEAEADFELRKLSAAQSFNEAERFLLETKRLEGGWTTDIPQKEGRGKLHLEALPDTSLEASIKLLALSHSYFANVKLHEKPVLGFKTNFAIDEMRSAHAKELYPKMRPAFKLQVEARPALNAAGKEAGKKAIDVFFDILEASLPLKVLDAFINLHPASEKHTLVCGIRAVNGDKAVEALELFPTIREGWVVKTNVAEHAGVKIHSVGVAPHRKGVYESVFAGEAIVYVGTSPDAVWGAAGVNALDELKAAIDQQQQPLAADAPVDQEFFKLQAQFGPLVDLLDAFRASEPKAPADDKEALELAKQQAKFRKLATEAFAPGDGVLESSLKRDANAVKGEMVIREGVLRFLGSAVADGVAENLQ